MYRLRYQKKDGTYTKAIISMDPDFRTIINYNQPMRVPFPYLNFGFRYKTVPGGFLYGGFYDRGLSVFFTKSPIDVGSKTFVSPTDYMNDDCYKGLSCTDHSWDHHVFDSPEQLMGTIINLWWSTNHYTYWPILGHYGACSNLHPWAKLSLSEALNFDWTPMPEDSGITGFLWPHVTSYVNLPVKLLIKERKRESSWP